MRAKTMMWNTFMTRGQNKCIIMVEYKGQKEEDAYVAPNSFDKTFEELGIHSGGQITLIEMRKGFIPGSDDEFEGDDEEGENEMEDMEAEQEEDNHEEAENEEEQPGTEQAPPQQEEDPKKLPVPANLA